MLSGKLAILTPHFFHLVLSEDFIKHNVIERLLNSKFLIGFEITAQCKPYVASIAILSVLIISGQCHFCPKL